MRPRLNRNYSRNYTEYADVDDLYAINVTELSTLRPAVPTSCAEARPRRCAAPWGMSPPAAAPAAGPGFSPARRDLLPCWRPSAAGCRGDVVGAHRPRPARLLRRLCALSRGSGAGVCAAGGHGGPSPSSWASSGGSSDGTPSARTRATRPRSPRAGACLSSPLSLPATHSSPAGAGRRGRRL